MMILNDATRLIDFANRANGSVFEWGETDCFLLTLAALDYAQGTELAGQFVGEWDDEDSARDYANTFYFDSWFRAVGGWKVARPNMTYGDILHRRVDGLPQLAMVLGTTVLSSRPDRNVEVLPLRDVILDNTWEVWRL